jgi:ATP-dependent exoDNAse (exonuclease V) alpha subunit
MLNRKLLYTALSRAKQSIILISTEENLKQCIKRKNKRNSLLDFMFIYHKDNQLINFIDFYTNYK